MRHNQATHPNSTMDRCIMLSSPTLWAGLESAVHPPFRRHFRRTRQSRHRRCPRHLRSVASNPSGEPSGPSTANRLTCTRAFGAVTPHTRALLLASPSRLLPRGWTVSKPSRSSRPPYPLVRASGLRTARRDHQRSGELLAPQPLMTTTTE